MSKIRINPCLFFNYEEHKPQFYSDYPFDILSLRLGEEVVSIIKKLIGYRIEDTRKCEGFTCYRKLYKNSRFYYCTKCYETMTDEGFIFCNSCKLLERECICYYYCCYSD